MGAIVPFLKAMRRFLVRRMFRPCRSPWTISARDGEAAAKEIVAVRIIELARRGERSPAKLRDRVLHEANCGAGLRAAGNS